MPLTNMSGDIAETSVTDFFTLPKLNRLLIYGKLPVIYPG